VQRAAVRAASGLVRGTCWWMATSLAMVGLSGCTSGSPSASGTPRALATYTDPSVYRIGESRFRQLVDGLDPASPQRTILADRRVTRAELDQAFATYTDCVEAAGITLTSSAWDPVTNTQRILAFAPRPGGTPTTATAGPSPEDACDERHWSPVSQIYAADTPPHMTPELAEAVVSCMAGRGYDVRGSEDFGAVVGAVGGHAAGRRVEAGRACLSAALPHLYPDLPYYPQP
jgi:hypothetical protein